MTEWELPPEERQAIALEKISKALVLPFLEAALERPLASESEALARQQLWQQIVDYKRQLGVPLVLSGPRPGRE